MGNPVTWFQIQGEDAKPLQAFYKKVFAWRIHGAPGVGMAMVEPEAGGIGGGIGSSGDGMASVAIYVEVDDLVAYLKRVVKAGGRLSLPPTELPGDMGSIAGFIDPAGNWVGLWQHVVAAAPAKKRAPAKPTAAKMPAKKPAKTPAKKPAKKLAKKPAKTASTSRPR